MKTHFGKMVAGLLALGLMLAPVVQAQSSYYFWWQVIDQRGRPYPSQAIRCSVYDYPASHSSNAGLGTGSAKLLHFDSGLGSGLANGGGSTMPLLSDANSRLHFYTSSASDVLVTCFYDRGGAATNVVISRNVHQVMIDREGRKVVRFPIASNAGTPTRTGIWFGPGDVIRDVLVNVTSGPYGTTLATTPAGASPGTPHLNVGFAGAHSLSTLVIPWANDATGPLVNGFCGACSPFTSALIHSMSLASDSVTAAGPAAQNGSVWLRPGVVIHSATGANRLHVQTAHRGIALAAWRSGSGGGASAGSNADPTAHSGGYMELSYPVPTNLEVTYTTSTVPGLAGHVYVFFDSMHAGSGFGGPSNSGLYPNTP